VLTNPEILALLGGLAAPRPHTPPEPSAPPPEEDSRPGLRDRLGAAGAWAGQKTRAAGQACARGTRWLKAGLLGAWQLRTRLLTTVGLGAAVGLGAYLAGPWLSALAGGALGCAVSLFARVRTWLQQLVFGWVLGDVSS
jgi:hypothetical protein